MKEHKLPKYVWRELATHNIKEGDVLCSAPADLSFDCEYISAYVFLTKKLIGVYTEKLTHKGVMRLLAIDDKTAQITIYRANGEKEDYHY